MEALTATCSYWHGKGNNNAGGKSVSQKVNATVVPRGDLKKRRPDNVRKTLTWKMQTQGFVLTPWVLGFVWKTLARTTAMEIMCFVSLCSVTVTHDTSTWLHGSVMHPELREYRSVSLSSTSTDPLLNAIKTRRLYECIKRNIFFHACNKGGLPIFMSSI